MHSRLPVVATCLVLLPLTAFAQSPAPARQRVQQHSGPAVQGADAPRIRRWFDLQDARLMSRYRWVKSNDDRITASALQWQPQVRGRFLIDAGARYSINFTAQSGGHFVSGWNNLGPGLGSFAGDFTLKHLFLAAEPIGGLELQIGGIRLLRGENTEITTYDNDSYIMGERVTYTRDEGPFAQLAATVGHIGDFRTPNVLRRFDSMDDVNYGQLLAGVRLGGYVDASADYTYEDGRDIIREGITLRMPEQLPLLASITFDAYQRTSDISGQGFNLAGELEIAEPFTVTVGVAHIDRQYLIPGYMSPNADRYERGTRFYSLGRYRVTREWSVEWFHTEAFNTDYVIPNEHRWDIVVTFNPTARLKEIGVF